MVYSCALCFLVSPVVVIVFFFVPSLVLFCFCYCSGVLSLIFLRQVLKNDVTQLLLIYRKLWDFRVSIGPIDH